MAMVTNARNQTVTELGPAAEAMATHWRLTPAVMKYRTTSPKPMARRSAGALAFPSSCGGIDPGSPWRRTAAGVYARRRPHATLGGSESLYTPGRRAEGGDSPEAARAAPPGAGAPGA